MVGCSYMGRYEANRGYSNEMRGNIQQQRALVEQSWAPGWGWASSDRLEFPCSWGWLSCCLATIEKTPVGHAGTTANPPLTVIRAAQSAKRDICSRARIPYERVHIGNQGESLRMDEDGRFVIGGKGVAITDELTAPVPVCAKRQPACPRARSRRARRVKARGEPLVFVLNRRVCAGRQVAPAA